MSKGIILSLCDFSGAWSRPFIEQGYTVIRVDPMHEAGRQATEGTSRPGSFDFGRMADGGYFIAATAGQFANWLAGHSTALERGLALHYLFNRKRGNAHVVGVLMAPPCTHFAGSGARWWAGKDARGETQQAIDIVLSCLLVKDLVRPDWWALENPVGRIARLVPQLQACDRITFDPCDFASLADDVGAEAYTKRTHVWGHFYSPMYMRDRVEPVMYERTRKDGTKVRGSWMWANLGGKSERTKALRSKTPTGFARAFAAAQTFALPHRDCGHSACGQNYIDNGNTACIAGEAA